MRPVGHEAVPMLTTTAATPSSGSTCAVGVGGEARATVNVCASGSDHSAPSNVRTVNVYS